MEPIETIDYRGYKIHLHIDDYPMNPRDWDNMGKMYCWYRDYNLGDKHKEEIETVQDWIERNEVIALPLFLYDHSGITMNTTGFSCRWDSGQVGYIVADEKALIANYGTTQLTEKQIEDVRQALKAEVEKYDQYIRGEVYGYIVESESDDHEESCWGYYRKVDAIADAQSWINYTIKERGEQINIPCV